MLKADIQRRIAVIGARRQLLSAAGMDFSPARFDPAPIHAATRRDFQPET